MKRKIIALVLVLVLIPSMLLAASTKYTKTEKVTYNPGKVTFDGVNINGSIKIGNATYINVSELSAILNKNCTKYNNGNIAISKKVSEYDFAKCNWGQDKLQIIKNEGTSPEINKTNYILYNSQMYYGQPCDVCYNFTNNKLTSGYYFIKVNETNCIDMFKHMTNLLYEQFDSIKEKGIHYKNDIPEDTPMLDAIKNDDIYLYAQYLNDTTQAIIFLQSDDNGSIGLTIGLYDISAL
jgi:hypothetical protein